MFEKWVRKLRLAMASTSACGAQDEKRSRTSENPARRKPKQATTERIKAITWFFVVAEIKAPTARNPRQGHLVGSLPVASRFAYRHGVHGRWF